MCGCDSTFNEQIRLRVLAARSARGLHGACPSKEEGAGNAGCALHPRSRVQVCAKNAHTSIQVQRRQSDFPCASGLTAYFVLSPVTGFLATVVWQIFDPQNLAPAPGRQDHTTSPYA